VKTKLLIFLSLILAFGLDAQAGSATWNLNPISGDWNTALNWMPPTIPNGPADVATFSLSNQTSVSIFGVEIDLSSLVFDPGASAFTIAFTVNLPLTGLTFSGIGIVNNSGVLQTFVCDLGTITFTQNATAGELIAYTNVYGMDFHDNASGGNCTFTREGNMAGLINFYDNSTADHATFTNNPGYGSAVIFYGNSTAGNATFTNEGGDYYLYSGVTAFLDTSTAADGLFIANGSLTNYYGYGLVRFWDSSKAGNGTVIANGGQVRDALGGLIELRDSSTAENGTFIANGGLVSGAFGGWMTFDDDATASAATLMAKSGVGSKGRGGRILFNDTSTGDTARVELHGNGFLDLRGHDTPELTIGSLEGDGLVFLGGVNLSIGSNNLSTIFSGPIEENSEDAIGALTKIGTGILTLTGANTYTGGTTIEGGKLVVNNRSGSGTGGGAVQVHAGILAGRGTIAGTVIVGTGSGTGAALAPGRRGAKTDTLTILSALTFQLDSTYKFEFKGSTGAADKVIANGVTINTGSLVALIALDSGTLPQGTVLIAIQNTAAGPIAGTFANLPDDSTFTIGNNTFQASYSGGDGNDLTLTVVP
jgi:autotransporter-associated beta strand protein